MIELRWNKTGAGAIKVQEKTKQGHIYLRNLKKQVLLYLLIIKNQWRESHEQKYGKENENENKNS